MQIVFVILLSLGAYSWYFLDRPVFGKTPSGELLERVKKSPNYINGSFVNLEETPNFAPGISMWDAAKTFLNKPKNTEPEKEIPSIKTHLPSLDPTAPQLVWFGHSSYYLMVDGIKILVDPVFSGNASPVSLFAKSFKGSDVYSAKDFPEVDILLITHDHYDHLDYKTVMELEGKYKRIITSLGVSAHLVSWGIDAAKITELDWWQESALVQAGNAKIIATPSRHFSGRKFTRNQSLWSSFVLKTLNYSIFLGGDSGYGKHFKEIGNKFGPFNLALLECGQYNAMWPYIHMMPEEVITAKMDLQADVLMPVHWAKFSLALHPWNESINRLKKEAELKSQKITTPLIGEVVQIGKQYPDSVWWNF
ncbi:MAG: MBL fold metallo-hydrolase [Bacteroidia bacterium]|nr:MBL fold metallo-hydrolase [Bacteroidia bacterium]